MGIYDFRYDWDKGCTCEIHTINLRRQVQFIPLPLMYHRDLVSNVTSTRYKMTTFPRLLFLMPMISYDFLCTRGVISIALIPAPMKVARTPVIQRSSCVVQFALSCCIILPSYGASKTAPAADARLRQE